MVRTPDKKRTGLFLLIGTIAFLLIFGIYLKRFFWSNGDNIVVMYFQESIKGLNVGSSVVFQGVEIGKVSKIDIEADMKTLTFSIPVYVNLDVSKTFIAKISKESRKNVLEALIKKGLRARLSTQNYLTGQLIVELAMLPDTPVVLENDTKEKRMLQIPTVLSPLSELSRGLQNISIKEVSAKLSRMIDGINEQIPLMLPQITEMTGTINRFLNNNTRLSVEALGNFNRTMIDLGGAARSFQGLSDYLERHPEALLRGKGE